WRRPNTKTLPEVPHPPAPPAASVSSRGELGEALFELAERLHGGAELLTAGVAFLFLSVGGEELPFVQLYVVHRDFHLGYVDLVFLAVHQVVITGDIGAVVADVAEEGAERTVVVEGKRQSADGAAGGFHLDAHVHGDFQLGVMRTFQSAGDGDGFAGL